MRPVFRGEFVVRERFVGFELPLTECEAGEEVEVVSLDADTGLGARLRELGLVPGVFVRAVRVGSPMIVEVGNARFCLRGEEASHVQVRISPCSDVPTAFAGFGLNLNDPT